MLSASLFFGIVFFQLSFISTEWAVFRRLEYGLYILYIVCISVYFILKYLFADAEYLLIGSFALDKHIPERFFSFLSYALYIKFGRRFLGTKQTPRLNRYFIILENFIIAYSLLSLIFLLITGNILLELQIYSVVFAITFIISVILLIRVYRVYNYAKYLIIGSSIVAIGGCLALYLGMAAPNFGIHQDHSNLFLQLGIIGDFIFLNIGLVVKTKTLQANEIARQIAVEQERARISAELHDDLGGGLSTIRLMAEMIKDPQFGINGDYLNNISCKSGELIQNMNEIVWSLNNNNDTFAAMILYLKQYAGAFLEEAGIRLSFKQPSKMPVIEVNGNIRRQVFLVAKEALNNIVRHSKADYVEIHITLGDQLHITIADNGKGIDTAGKELTGNGLHNMKQRIENLKGQFEIIYQQGTHILFSVPFSSLYNKSVM